MIIKSAEFVKSVVAPDRTLNDGRPQVAFIGRSNVGKSSTINALTHKKDLAKTSSAPGRTQQLNLFLINASFYLVDLPGYGYAKASHETRERLQDLIDWYLLSGDYEQRKVVVIIDAVVGVTENDMEMLYALEEQNKNIVIVANKIDKLKKNDTAKQLQKIQGRVGTHLVIPFSAEKKIGITDLTREILK